MTELDFRGGVLNCSISLLSESSLLWVYVNDKFDEFFNCSLLWFNFVGDGSDGYGEDKGGIWLLFSSVKFGVLIGDKSDAFPVVVTPVVVDTVKFEK